MTILLARMRGNFLFFLFGAFKPNFIFVMVENVIPRAQADRKKE